MSVAVSSILIMHLVIPTPGHEDTVRDLATSPDGKWVATASGDSTIILWDTTNGAVVQQWVAHNYRAITSLDFSPDGQHLVSCGDKDSTIKVWEISEGSRELATLKGHIRTVNFCRWSHRGDVIASMSYDKTMRLWDAHTFHQLHMLESAGGEDMTFIVFSPDGHWLFIGSSLSYTYDIWNVDSGTVHKSFRSESKRSSFSKVTYAAFDCTSSGTRLAIVLGGEDNVVKISDVGTGEELAVLRCASETNNVAFSSDGTLVATGSRDGAVKIWDAYMGVELFSLKGHVDDVCQARFSPCGEYLASGSYDGMVRLWRTRDGLCVGTFSEHMNSRVRHVAFSADGKTLWSADIHGTVIMRRMRDIIPEDEQ